MSATQDESEEPERKEYELDGPRRVVRAGLVIEEGETVEMLPEEFEEHSDVLQPVDGSTTASDSESNETGDESGEGEEGSE